MTTHSSILAQKIPWTEESGRLQSTGLDTTEQLTYIKKNIIYMFVCVYVVSHFKKREKRGKEFRVVYNLNKASFK